MRISIESLTFLLLTSTSITAFTPQHSLISHRQRQTLPFVLHSTTAPRSSSDAAANDAAFAAFAETLDEDDIIDSADESWPTWKESLDEFLDPLTPLSKKQILLAELVNANEDIRGSVEEAIRERKIDPLLTPTAQKLQKGTRAVARQIASDILPTLSTIPKTNPPPTINELPTIIPKITSRVFDAVSTQARKNLDQLQRDLSDPSRIPERLSQQSRDLAQEMRNAFRETPEGLAGPPYTVVSKGEGYEIRDYGGYDAATATMTKIDEEWSMDDVAGSGAAFNALAAYIFGANEDKKSLDMTTPVVTTSSGEMRFYLKTEEDGEGYFPRPLTAAEQKYGERMEVSLVKIPAARLAVATFPGFATEGEVARQKDALLTRLSLDGVELDVPHGKTVPHVVLQYNPPYTLPIIRRNEVAVPVSMPEMEGLEKEWRDEDVKVEEEEEDDLAPSDVE